MTESDVATNSKGPGAYRVTDNHAIADSLHQALCMALTNQDLEQIVQYLADMLEKQAVHQLTAIISVATENSNTTFITAGAPSYPGAQAWWQCTDMTSDTTPAQACFMRGEPIHISDIANAVEWREFCQLAEEQGITAIRCRPIFSQVSHTAVAIISLFYYRQPSPDEHDFPALDALSPTLALIVDKYRERQTKKRIEEAQIATNLLLFKQHRMYEAALSNNPDPVYTFDLTGRFTFVNNALLSIWGCNWEDAIGKSMYELRYEKWQADMHMAEIRQVIETKRPVRGDIPYHGEQGLRVYDYIMVPVFDADGNVEAIAGSTRDVTERFEAEKMAKRAESRRRLALEASHSFGIWDWDIKNNIFKSDQRLGELFNLSPEEAEHGVPIERPQAFIHPEDVENVNATIQKCIATGDLYDQRYRILQDDGSIRWCAFRGRVLYDETGEPASFPGVGVDVTAEQNALSALQEADRRKDEFLATLAHELRNPLAPIRNALGILQSSQFTEAQKTQSFRLVERQVIQMIRLVDDLMDVSRITLGKIRLSLAPLNICDAIRDALETVRPLIDDNRHTLAIRFPDDCPWVNGDRVRLAQIFTNIINNAAKYTPEGGKIEVSVRRSDRYVIIEISDNGVGIPADKLNDVFDMFSQIESALERSQGGLGIGLTLVKRLVELQDGEVRVQSDKSGTLFSVAFPLAEATSSPPSEQQDTNLVKAGDATLMVLIVDDNQDAAITMGWLLEVNGCNVKVVDGGVAALAAVGSFTPDLVLLDIGMPDINGFDLCVALKKIPALQHAIFVAQTGWGQPYHIQRSKQSGFHHHLVKPIALNDLLPIVEAARQCKAQRQL